MRQAGTAGIHTSAGENGLALVVMLYLEHFDLDGPEAQARGRTLPSYRHYGWLEYGNRVGMFRILELLDRHGLKATVAANSSACRAYPQLVEMLAGRGYEFAAHGRAVNQLVTEGGEADLELAAMRECVAAIESAVGKRVRGWVSQDFLQSARTVALAGWAGLDYVADFANAEAPFTLAEEGDVLCLPNGYELDDARVLNDRRVNAWDYADMVVEAFGVLATEAGDAPTVMCLPVHPWVLGAPHRFRYLVDVLERISAAGGYWSATAGEIAGRYRLPGAPPLETLRFT